jgi:hypothetical protein
MATKSVQQQNRRINAKMRLGTLFPLLCAIASSSLYADFKSELGDSYAKGVNALLFFTSEDIISSGHYTFDNWSTTLDTHFIPFTYQFESNSDIYNFYANGSIGFSKYEEDVDLARGSQDKVNMTTYAIKIGGGMRIDIAKDTDMMIGASYIYSKVKSSYSTSKPLDKTAPKDKEIDTILNSNRSHNTYELSSSIGYHPTLSNGYQPYARVGMRYFDTSVDAPYATISDTESSIVKIKAGVVTPVVTSIYDLPLKLEFYTSGIFIGGDMSEILNIDNFFVAGTTFHLGSSSIVKWVDEVTFDINVVKGDNFDGFNFGLGLSF